MYGVDTYRYKDGLFVKKMKCDHPDMSKNKLIICNKQSFTGTFIDKGKLGLVGGDKFYILGDKLELLKAYLDTPLAYIACHYTKYRQDFLDREAFTFIPDIRKIQDYTYDKLCIDIGLTKEEMNSLKR